MDVWVLYAINTFFVVAVAAPPLLVIIYRWKEVPLRRAEIERMMVAAFETSDQDANKAAREALANNPYVSDPQTTFDRYHNPARYVFPWLVMAALTCSSTYVVYAWVYD